MASSLGFSEEVRVEGADYLEGFFKRLAANERVQVVQLGDSHTTAMDWQDAMRVFFQKSYGPSFAWDNIGLKGAHMRKLLEWSEQEWNERVLQLGPALIVLAYGTNEALYPYWTAESYKTDLAAVVVKIRRILPETALLFVGPPACGKGPRFGHLTEVIAIQRRVALTLGCAFWNWQAYMNVTGGRASWFRKGFSRPDYVHFTKEGYRLVGNVLAREIEKAYLQYQEKELIENQ